MERKINFAENGIKSFKEKKKSKIANILIFYVYFPFVWIILEQLVGMATYVQYIILGGLVFVIFLVNPKINKKVLLFALIFAVSIMLNYLLVSYSYYVGVEGIQAFFSLLVPCVCVTCTYFDLGKFIKHWHKFALWNWPILIIIVCLYRANLIHYAVFTGLCVPNVFILSFDIIQIRENVKMSTIVSLINIIAVSILGGRMSAAVCIMMFVISHLFSSNISLAKKLVFGISITILTIVIITHFQDILLWMNNWVQKYGIRSRSISLMVDQLSSKELYLTNRDTIYSLTLQFIRNNMGLPGGLGVALYITSGQYYYVHNFVLQLITIFGIPGTLIILALLIVKFWKYRNRIDKRVYYLLVYLFGVYMVIGLTGSSIFIHFMSTIFIALFFFTQPSKLRLGEES